MLTQSTSWRPQFKRITDAREYLGLPDGVELPTSFQTQVKLGKYTLQKNIQLGYETDTSRVTLYVDEKTLRGECFDLLGRGDDRNGLCSWFKFAQRSQPDKVVYVMLTKIFM